MTETITDHNTECNCPTHNRHLCYLASQGFDLSDPVEYKALISEPKHKCSHCGRLANSDQSLCKPDKL